MKYYQLCVMSRNYSPGIQSIIDDDDSIEELKPEEPDEDLQADQIEDLKRELDDRIK